MPQHGRTAGRRSFGGRGSSTPRRSTEWIAGTRLLSDLVVTNRIVIDFAQAELAALVPFTITRTIYSWMTAIDSSFVTDQDYFAGLGGCIVTEQARVAGVASVPAPISHMGSDVWFLHHMSMAYLEEPLTSNAASVTSRMNYIDSRGQRKVEDGEAIVFIEENQGGDTMQVASAVRILCKLY